MENTNIPTPNINPDPSEQQVRTMRADLGAPLPPVGGGLPSFDAEEPAFTPETTNQIPSVDQIVSEGGSKRPFWIIGGVLVVFSIGWYIYGKMEKK